MADISVFILSEEAGWMALIDNLKAILFLLVEADLGNTLLRVTF